MDTARASRLKVVRLTSAMVREGLAAYERKYGMPSAEFYERYCAGELPEAPYAPEYFDWAGLCFMALHETELRHLFDRP